MVFNGQIYCALIVLLELMAVYGRRGCLLVDIAHKHRIPIAEMESVVTTLGYARIVIVRGQTNQWLLLAKEPATIRVLHIIELFIPRFCGVFTDPDSGKATPKNKTLLFLDEQRKVVEDSIRHRWFSITLERLYHMKRSRFLL